MNWRSIKNINFCIISVFHYYPFYKNLTVRILTGEAQKENSFNPSYTYNSYLYFYVQKS